MTQKYYRDRHGHRQDSHFETVPCDCPKCKHAAAIAAEKTWNESPKRNSTE